MQRRSFEVPHQSQACQNVHVSANQTEVNVNIAEASKDKPQSFACIQLFIPVKYSDRFLLVYEHSNFECFLTIQGIAYTTFSVLIACCSYNDVMILGFVFRNLFFSFLVPLSCMWIMTQYKNIYLRPFHSLYSTPPMEYDKGLAELNPSCVLQHTCTYTFWAIVSFKLPISSGFSFI